MEVLYAVALHRLINFVGSKVCLLGNVNLGCFGRVTMMHKCQTGVFWATVKLGCLGATVNLGCFE